MFESVNELSKRLPRPGPSDDLRINLLVRERYIANGRLLRSEAMASIGRALMAWLRRGWRQVPGTIFTPPPHRV